VSRGPQTFRQRDVTAALKAAKAAGCEVERIEVGKDGRIIVILANVKGHEQTGGARNEWDEIFRCQKSS
jgi:hypothetical protein